MTRPSRVQSFAIIPNTHETHEIRLCQVGKGPLAQLWVQETGGKGAGIILNVEQATDLVESLNDLLDILETIPAKV